MSRRPEEEGTSFARALHAELRSDILNFRFPCAVLLLVWGMLASAAPYREHLSMIGGSMEGPAWLAVFTFCLSSEQALLVIPLAAPAVAAAGAQDELGSRYALFLAQRTGRKKYLAAKAAGLGITGGLTVLSSLVIVLTVSFFWCAGIPDLSAGRSMEGFWFVGSLLRGALNGALWSLVGGAAAVAARSRYLSFTAPFILYYVLSVFQERYYGQFPALSPRQWAFPVQLTGCGCIFILLLLSVLAAVFLTQAMRRRMR